MIASLYIKTVNVEVRGLSEYFEYGLKYDSRQFLGGRMSDIGAFKFSSWAQCPWLRPTWEGSASLAATLPLTSSRCKIPHCSPPPQR